MNGDFVFIAFIAIVLIFMLVGAIAQRSRMNELIEQAVKDEEGRSIEISRVWFDGDEDTLTFTVRFVDKHGTPHTTSCKTRRSNGSLYWTRTPAELTASHAPKPATALHASSFASYTKQSSSKEEIIASLTAENQRLREELARQKAK